MKEPPRRNRVRRAGKTLVALAAVLMFFRWFEHTQVYHPDRQMIASADALGRPARDVFFTAGDGVRLNGWFFPGNTNSPLAKKVVLQCHGNAGNISSRLDHFELILGTGVSLFAFDYRGYGRSEGRPSEKGTYRDAEAAYQWLRKEGFAAEDIIVLGESLGGGIASQLAATQPVGGLILQSTFTSIPDVGREVFPWLPVRLLATIHYDTHSRLPRIKAPVLVMHGRADEIIPFHHGERNFAAANEPKLFRELAGGHNDWLEAGGDKCSTAMTGFFNLIEETKSKTTLVK